ncbi:SGNH/GDSL hydrolase family protein [Geodermatophilus sp. SYSU D01106]
MALVVLNGALFTYLALRPAPVDPLAGRTPSPAAQTSDVATPPTSASPAAATSAPSAPPVLAVYGDGYSAGSALGGQGATGWPALVAAGTGAELRLTAAARAGYAAVGATGQDFAGLVTSAPVPDATVTVVFGSRNDYGQPLATVSAGAAATLQTLRQAAPETELVVVGPAWSDADVPAELLEVRNAVEEAAGAVDATFVDPLEAGWFSEPAGLIAPDGVSPTDAGHAFIASSLTPVLTQALSASTTSN